LLKRNHLKINIMKFHLTIPFFHIRHQESKVFLVNENVSIVNMKIESSKKNKKSIINKLSPTHWYDGVWENLDYKM
jgi:hypothetical protein